jgi:putative toxin-antitoxin system antitoxin component (TIGR02293 family)
MGHAHTIIPSSAPAPSRRETETRKTCQPSRAGGASRSLAIADPVIAALEAERGIAKSTALRLFERIADASPVPLGRLRAELIPDSSWKRAGKTLGPQASQTAARLGFVLAFADRVWGNGSDAVEWLLGSHAELAGASPYSLLKTEAGGRAVEALLAALEFGFPV